MSTPTVLTPPAPTAGAAGDLWDVLVPAFRKLELDDFRLRHNGKPNSRSVQLYPRYVIDDRNAIRYEWLLRKTAELDVALHFDFPAERARAFYVALLAPHETAIRRGISFPYRLDVGDAQACFTLPVQRKNPTAVAAKAVQVMDRLIERTWPLLEPLLPRDSSMV